MFDLADIRRLLDAFEKSDWDEVRVTAEGFEVHIASGRPSLNPGGASEPQRSVKAAAGRAKAEPVNETGGGDSAAAGPDEAAATGVMTADEAQQEGLHAVVSPSPGIFYCAPAPGKPPFVEVGQTVSEDTPVGIVEVMKLMNHVVAGVRGTVRAILVENAAPVQRSDPLILIEPET